MGSENCQWRLLLCCFCLLTSCGCRDRVARDLVFCPPVPRYIFLEKRQLSETETECKVILAVDANTPARRCSCQKQELAYCTHTKPLTHQDLQHLGVRTNALSEVRGLYTVTKQGNRIGMVYYPHGESKYLVLFAHGNACDLGSCISCIQEMRNRLGVSVLAFDYSGYGVSEGSPSVSCVRGDIEAALRVATTTLRHRVEDIVLYGQSLGTGAVCHIAPRVPVAGVILHSPLASGLRVLRSDVKRDYCCDIFPNHSRVRSVKSPVFVIHGSNDQQISLEHGQQVFDNAAVAYGFWNVRGAGHNDIEVVAGDEYWRRVRAFLQHVFEGNVNDGDDASTSPARIVM
ncbi:MAG: hypothetical protein MHM6MM_002564 [Cercozoa sp. M6MM]